MNDLLIYSLPTNGLRAAIAVAKEIHSEMGMKPDEIRLSTGERVSYNWQDIKALEHGEMSEEIYISKNKIA
jgi:hypothetical protein|nr:MAG TPA: hypothetical protein [Caudoviricetes sp.]